MYAYVYEININEPRYMQLYTYSCVNAGIFTLALYTVLRALFVISRRPWGMCSAVNAVYLATLTTVLIKVNYPSLGKFPFLTWKLKPFIVKGSQQFFYTYAWAAALCKLN